MCRKDSRANTPENGVIPGRYVSSTCKQKQIHILYLITLEYVMNKKQSRTLKLMLLLTAPFIFFNCVSTPNEKTPPHKQDTSESSLPEKKQEKPSKTQPPEVVFVEGLQKSLQSESIDDAIAYFDKMPSSLEGNDDMKILKASLLISANRTEEATEIADEILKSSSSNIDALELCAQIAIASGNKEAQNTAINKLLAIDPNNATANVIQGNQQALKKKYKLAKNNYAKAIKGDPNNTDAVFGYAKMSYYTNNISTSEKYFKRLLEIDPNSSIAYQYLGKLAAEKENYLAASEYIEKAIKIDPNNYNYFIDLGQYMRFRGKYSEAEKAWTRAIEIDPTYFLAYTYRAGLRDEQDRFADALADYNKIVETNPKYYFAYEEIGILEFHEKNWTKCRTAFEKANAIKPSSAYQLMIVITYLQEKKTVDAKAYAATCMKTMSRDSLDYKIMRLFHDQGPINAENAVARDLANESSSTKRGKMTFYFAMYYWLKNSKKIATEYFGKIVSMQSPMFFEYRLAEWALNENPKEK